MKVKIPKKDLLKCFEFAVKYHLDENKSNVNRTTGQYRGLGSIIDSFLLGKFNELGVAKAIEYFNSNIKCKVDFEIYPLKKDKRSEPDITMIKENGIERDPNLFVEIKYISPEDRWVGLSKEQLDTILKNKLVQSSGKNVFLIYASLETDSGRKNSDLLGALLKNQLKTPLFYDFCEITNLYIEIKYVISCQELLKYGVPFNKGSYMYEVNLIGEPFDDIKAKKTRSSGYTKKVPKTKYLPITTRDNKQFSKEIGKLRVKGNYAIYIKKNEKSNRVYIDCITKVIISNKVAGKFILKKGKMYELSCERLGRSPELKRNNVWIANRNLHNIVREKPEKRMKYIANNI